MTETLESVIRAKDNRRMRVRKPTKRQQQTSTDQPTPPWEAEAGRLYSLIQKTPDPETLAQLTESVTAIQAAIDTLDEEAQRATEYTRHRKLIPNACACALIRPALMVAEGYVDCALGTSSRLVLRSMLYPSERLLAIKSSLRIDVHIKQPRRSTCQGLIRAFRAGEFDAESFLAWFREQTMGLLGPQLDPYIVQVLLGMHVSHGELRLPGDMQNLTGLDEQELIRAILGRARGRKHRDQSEAGELVKVLGPGQQRNGPTCDTMNLVIQPMWTDSNGEKQPYDLEEVAIAPEVAYLSEIGELFASPGANEGTVAAAILRAAGREQIERIGRKARLTRKESRFLHRRALGTVTKREDENLWKAVNGKMTGIRKALADVRFGQIL